jgi:hypothetical protein
MMTLREKYGTLDGLKVAIIGDISHSRVAGSNMRGLKTMGAEVMVCGPQTLMPRDIETLGVGVSHSVDEALGWADALNVLRIQLERQDAGLFPSLREYHRYGITRRRLEKSGRDLFGHAIGSHQPRGGGRAGERSGDSEFRDPGSVTNRVAGACGPLLLRGAKRLCVKNRPSAPPW